MQRLEPLVHIDYVKNLRIFRKKILQRTNFSKVPVALLAFKNFNQYE